MAKYLPNPANLSLFKLVMASSPGLKTEVSIYAADSAQAKSKVEAMWNFPVLSVKLKEAPAPPEPPPTPVRPTKTAHIQPIFFVPDDAPLGLFTYCNAAVPTEEQAHAILLAFEQHVTRPGLLQNCTSGKKLLPDKPVDGVFAFIWQLARYMNGEDVHVSATAFIDLIDGTSRLTHLRVDSGAVKTITKFLETQAGHLVKATRAAR